MSQFGVPDQAFRRCAFRDLGPSQALNHSDLNFNGFALGRPSYEAMTFRPGGNFARPADFRVGVRLSPHDRPVGQGCVVEWRW